MRIQIVSSGWHHGGNGIDDNPCHILQAVHGVVMLFTVNSIV
jgi:hypothetical protein